MKLGITEPKVESNVDIDQMECVLALILQMDYKFKYNVDFAPEFNATKHVASVR